MSKYLHHIQPDCHDAGLCNMMPPRFSILPVITAGNFSLHSKYWPLFLLFFYILAPIPYGISRRIVDDTDSASNACKELALFLTTGIVVSAFGLPIIFARADVVSTHFWDFCVCRLSGVWQHFALIPVQLQHCVSFAVKVIAFYLHAFFLLHKWNKDHSF